MTNPKLPRITQGMILALVLLTVIVVALALAQSGIPEAKRCASSIWKIQLPKWVGCMMAAHENLAGGLIGAGGALFAGWLAWSAVREQIDLERASHEPEVVAYLLPDRGHVIFLNLVVANVGRGAARAVTVELDAEPDDFTRHGVRFPAKTPRPVLAVMPQDERFHIFFGSALEMLGDPPLKDFKIIVRFEDAHGKLRTNNLKGSVVDFKGHGTLGMPPEYETAEGIKKIAEEVRQWGSGFRRLKVETITAAEEAQRRKEEYERARDAAKNLAKPDQSES